MSDLEYEWEEEWAKESKKERGRVLDGSYRHYCWEWDGMTMDDSCPEWPCHCLWYRSYGVGETV